MVMKSVAFIRSNDWFKSDICHGTHNGYVAVPPTNKYHGKHYADLGDIEVHGGLTFSKPVINEERSFGLKRKINLKYVGKRNPILDSDIEFISDNTEIGDDWWIFGFDTFHFNDDEISCDKEYVIQETLDLQRQLEEE